MTAAATHVVVHDSPEVVWRRQRLGVLLLIVADVAFVLSLVFAYLYLRGLDTEGGWLPKDGPQPAGAGLGWLIAAVMATSWLCYRWAESSARAGRRELVVLGVLAAVVLVVADLALQIYQMVTAGFVVADGSYESAFMALTGYHVVHLTLTFLLGVGIWNRARLGLVDADTSHLRLVGFWWTWVVLSAVLTAAVTSLTASPHAGS
ncbi:MAG TPA: cytochrome c oxidase subunit 3 [Kineosporiaceae bacterium]|nr:cytochrome c oxidase subunit 3 [Kineosporiaceae bacterium]